MGRKKGEMFWISEIPGTPNVIIDGAVIAEKRNRVVLADCALK
jgi:hypothetical protein